MGPGSIGVALESNHVADQTVVRLVGPWLDASAAKAVRNELLRIARESSALILDLSAIRYVDVFGFELVLEAVRLCPGKARLSGLTPGLRSLTVLNGLENLIAISPDVESALAANASGER